MLHVTNNPTIRVINNKRKLLIYIQKVENKKIKKIKYIINDMMKKKSYHTYRLEHNQQHKKLWQYLLT